MLLGRVLLTKNMEIYQLKEFLYKEALFVLILFDHRRKSCATDETHRYGCRETEFVPADNYIQAFVLHSNEVSDEQREEIYEIISAFFEFRDNCDWNIEYEKYDLKKLKGIEVSEELLIKKMAPVLKKLGLPNNLDQLDRKSFNNLMQE